MTKDIAERIKTIRAMTTKLEFACMVPIEEMEASIAASAIIHQTEELLYMIEGTAGK